MNEHRPAWSFHHVSARASDFHAMNLDQGRALWWCTVEAPAVILGSTQSNVDVDFDKAQQSGLEIVHRRSGGGIVYLHPEDAVWVDITIPRNDPMWSDDVSESMLWIGEVFVRALQPWINATVYRGAFEIGLDGRVVCFASTSPGEVFVENKKVVGISQRRTRDGARFQCVLYRRWNPHEWAHVLTDTDVALRVDHMPVTVVDAPALSIVDEVRTALTHF